MIDGTPLPPHALALLPRSTHQSITHIILEFVQNLVQLPHITDPVLGRTRRERRGESRRDLKDGVPASGAAVHNCAFGVHETEGVEGEHALVSVVDVEETPFSVDTFAEGAPEASGASVIHVDATQKR